jgi:rRNA-processing protein FCF1
MKTVLLDTNFLMIPATLKVDIFSEIERIMDEPHVVAILDRSVGELQAIIEHRRGKERQAARLALQLVTHKGLACLKTESNKILNRSNSKSFIVATQDSDLKRKLKAKSVPIIVLRQKRYLTIIRS